MNFNVKHLIAVLFFVSFNVCSQFSEISNEAGIETHCYTPLYMGGGVATFDFNNDGWEDIYITGGINSDAIYINNGDGTFEKKGNEIGLFVTLNSITTGVTTGDIDNDGVREIFVYCSMPTNFTFITPTENFLFKQNEDGTLTDISEQAGIIENNYTMAASFGDYNLDGYLDLFVANYLIQPQMETDSLGNITFTHLCWDNQMYVNNGDGTFTEQSINLNLSNSGCALAATFTDLDFNHIPDIYLANDFGEFITPNAAYLNNFPEDNFTNVAETAGLNAGIYGMGIATGDFDNDLDLDYYVTNIGRNVFFENNGNLIFSDISTETYTENTYADSLFATGWGCNFADFNNDSHLDLFVSNGHIPAADFIATNEVDPNKLYLNNGDKTFTDFSSEWNIDKTDINRGSAIADFDNDGDIDIINVTIHAFEEPEGTNSFLFRNDQNNNNNWIKVKLTGVFSNRDAFGSKIIVHTPNQSFLREIGGGSSHASQNSSIAHFGLGSISQIDSIEVFWVGGKRQVETNISTNQTLNIIEQEFSTSNESSPTIQASLFPNILSSNTQFTVESDNIIKSIFLKDINGRIIATNSKIKSKNFSYTLGQLTNKAISSGIYLLEINFLDSPKVIVNKIFVN